MRFAMLLLVIAALGAVETRPGTVSFSDGTTLSGGIAMSPGARLQLHDGHAMREIDPATVAELRFAPEREEMMRSFAMPEAGRTVRVETGESYAIRYLTTTVVLVTGEVIGGHLNATAITIDMPGADADNPEHRRLPLPAKQRGKPGEEPEKLVYPCRVVFTPAAGAVPANALEVKLAGGADELGAVARAGLVPLAVRRGAGWSFSVDAPLGSPVFWAARRGGHVGASWPGDDPALRARISALLPKLNEYFDGRSALAVWQDTAAQDVFSLMLLERKAKTTNGDRRQWHVEVWRWRLDGDRAILGGRAALLRGELGPGEVPPTVAVVPGWDSAVVTAGVLSLEGWRE